MTCFAYDKTGSVRDNPGTVEILELLQSMSSAASDQPDVSLNNDDGWSISYSSTRTVVFGNPETGQGPWHMKGVPVDQAHDLWRLFADAKLAELQSRPWLPGRG